MLKRDQKGKLLSDKNTGLRMLDEEHTLNAHLLVGHADPSITDAHTVVLGTDGNKYYRDLTACAFGELDCAREEIRYKYNNLREEREKNNAI